MKTIIAGSRGVTDFLVVCAAVEASGFLVSSVISGGARGVDTLAERWAWMRGLPFTEHPANWDRYGKLAGRIRNNQMAEGAQALISVWDGESRGSAHMIECAMQNKLQIYVYNLTVFGLE